MPHFDWTQYGIAGVVIGVLFFILLRRDSWMMKWIEKINQDHNAERAAMNEQYNAERIMYLKALDNMNASIQIHNQGSMEAREQAKEAHNYQREEHKQMIETLGRINGYKK